jgi:hypothetical protein
MAPPARVESPENRGGFPLARLMLKIEASSGTGVSPNANGSAAGLL